MKKTILAMLAAVSLGTPALADDSKITKGYGTMDSLGCMILRECTDEVEQVFSLLDISSQYPNTDEFTFIADEFNRMLTALNAVGVKVFLAPEKYFPYGHRGVYHTVGNNFFLNRRYMSRPGALMSVMRHEGWHAAQDCMAGTIDNSMIAIILPEEDVPPVWREMVERTYPANAVPWEAEATWAGKSEKMTQDALESCARGSMWTDYEPTPLTREWLEENNYLPHIEYEYEYNPYFFYYPQAHSHYHYHPKTDKIHAHYHKHGYGHRHHRVGKKHKAYKFHHSH